MNDEISDTDCEKQTLQGVAFMYHGMVQIFDKDVRDGNTPPLMEVLNSLLSEGKSDK